MDTEPHASATSGTYRSGGTIEPGKDRSRAVQEAAPASPAGTARLPRAKPGERYELRDPFEEVIYHGTSIAKMRTRAEQLGSTRFTAIDAQGRRSFVQKQQDGWHRVPIAGPQRPESPVHGTARPNPTTGQQSLDLGRPGSDGHNKSPSDKELRDDRARRIEQLEAALSERYLIKRAPLTVGPLQLGQTEYRFRGDSTRLAFTESTFKLATDTNSPSVARSMVDVAETRGWQGLRVSGNEEFRRMVWMEASLRGIRSQGYEPQAGDMELLRKEQQARQLNRIEPVHAEPSSPQEKPRGRKTVLAAIESILVAQHIPEARRQAVLAAAEEQLAQRQRSGQSFQVKVYDKPSPAQARAIQEPSRTLDKHRQPAAPAR